MSLFGFNLPSSHIGSWGLPEYGITEAVQSIFKPKAAYSYEGGSELISPQSQPVSYPTSGPMSTQTGPMSVGTQTLGTAGGGQTGGGGGGQVSGDGGGGQQEQQGPSLEEQINAIFEPSRQYLSEAESRLRGDLPTTLSEIGQQFETGQKELETGKAQTERQIGESETEVRRRKQESEAASRRLFQELGIGGLQRFGGASSAGEAFGQLNVLEQQRRARDIAGNFNTAQREIENQRVGVEENFQTALNNLRMQRDQAVNQANRDFQSKLLEISRLRGENESAKAQARLQALTDLRNQIFQVQLANQQFQQAINTQRQQNLTQLGAAEQALASAVSGAGSAQLGFAQGTTLTPQTALTVSGQAGPTAMQPTGSIRDDEELMGRVAMGPRQDELFRGSLSPFFAG